MSKLEARVLKALAAWLCVALVVLLLVSSVGALLCQWARGAVAFDRYWKLLTSKILLSSVKNLEINNSERQVPVRTEVRTTIRSSARHDAPVVHVPVRFTVYTLNLPSSSIVSWS